MYQRVQLFLLGKFNKFITFNRFLVTALKPSATPVDITFSIPGQPQQTQHLYVKVEEIK